MAPAKQPFMSVPPLMELKYRSFLISRYTYSNPSGESVDAVCEISLSALKSYFSAGFASILMR
ncbi:MAG: hypothetical protein ACTSRI_17385 [Promethearchaeota archaeon]